MIIEQTIINTIINPIAKIASNCIYTSLNWSSILLISFDTHSGQIKSILFGPPIINGLPQLHSSLCPVNGITKQPSLSLFNLILHIFFFKAIWIPLFEFNFILNLYIFHSSMSSCFFIELNYQFKFKVYKNLAWLPCSKLIYVINWKTVLL